MHVASLIFPHAINKKFGIILIKNFEDSDVNKSLCTDYKIQIVLIVNLLVLKCELLVSNCTDC